MAKQRLPGQLVCLYFFVGLFVICQFGVRTIQESPEKLRNVQNPGTLCLILRRIRCPLVSGSSVVGFLDRYAGLCVTTRNSLALGTQ
jgi:hypothetical protein